MTSLIYLTPADFTVAQDTMSHNIKGVSVVLFYAPSCKHSVNILPIFKKLPRTVKNGCQFALVNVGYYKDIISMSQPTTTQLEYVPYIVMYIDGVPQTQFEDEITLDNLVGFVTHSIDTQQTLAEQTAPAKPARRSRPYCEGQPLCGDDDRCYLIVSTA